MIERTLCIIKPDAFESKEAILHDLTVEGFKIVKYYNHNFSVKEVSRLYEEHVGKDFYPEHEAHMISGPSVVVLLEKENAIKDYRKLMGFYQPSEAEEGTLRNKYGTESPANAVHGSDSPETAKKEINLLFGSLHTI